ncbi:AroM family protein [Roseomonas elaeocarpi]|uniref:AroM family protein n=1 Tax=Roseomonas elaeocarpi TaxID=907779 RepID=A0ABV6JP25_9PROT
MSPRKLGTITIGQAPRADITPILDAALPPALPRQHVGLLDGLDRDAIAHRFGPRPGHPVLVSRLLDGGSVTVDKERAEAVIQERVTQLEDEGCTTILLLCTGRFDQLTTRAAALIEPERILAPSLPALAAGRQVGILVPLAEQIASEGEKWRALERRPIFAAASPYDGDEAPLVAAARSLRDRGAELLMTDCMGFCERHREVAREASGLPVVIANAVIAKLVAEIV